MKSIKHCSTRCRPWPHIPSSPGLYRRRSIHDGSSPSTCPSPQSFRKNPGLYARSLSRFQEISLHIFSITTEDVVNANKPESVVASPYDGIRNGSIVIMKIPNPKPVVRWIKLAAIVSKMIYAISGMVKFIRWMSPSATH